LSRWGSSRQGGVRPRWLSSSQGGCRLSAWGIRCNRASRVDKSAGYPLKNPLVSDDAISTYLRAPQGRARAHGQVIDRRCVFRAKVKLLLPHNCCRIIADQVCIQVRYVLTTSRYWRLREKRRFRIFSLNNLYIFECAKLVSLIVPSRGVTNADVRMNSSSFARQRLISPR
jgi:hypothetical protein